MSILKSNETVMSSACKKICVALLFSLLPFMAWSSAGSMPLVLKTGTRQKKTFRKIIDGETKNIETVCLAGIREYVFTVEIQRMHYCISRVNVNDRAIREPLDCKIKGVAFITSDGKSFVFKDSQWEKHDGKISLNVPKDKDVFPVSDYRTSSGNRKIFDRGFVQKGKFPAELSGSPFVYVPFASDLGCDVADGMFLLWIEAGNENLVASLNLCSPFYSMEWKFREKMDLEVLGADGIQEYYDIVFNTFTASSRKSGNRLFYKMDFDFCNTNLYERYWLEKYFENSMHVFASANSQLTQRKESRKLMSLKDRHGFANCVDALLDKNEGEVPDEFDFFSNALKENGLFSSVFGEHGKSIEAQDVLECSVVVPDLGMVSKGDFLLWYDDDFSRFETAVVIDSRGPDKKKIDLACLDESSGKIVKINLHEFENRRSEKKFMPCRLTVSDSKSGVFAVPDWDCLDTSVDSGLFCFDSCYEETQSLRDGSRWNFIPNTGEWLVVAKPYLKLANRAGIPVTGTEDTSVVLELIDRNYDGAKRGNKNICNNSPGSAFAMKLVLDNGRELEYGSFHNEGQGLYSSHVTLKEKLLPSKYGRLAVLDGNLLFEVEAIKIRPESSSSWNNGDDFILTASLASKKGKVEIKSRDEDFFVCYDKKALWRANLYISTEKGDWNDMHPWNAPPEVNPSRGQENHWWSTDWGFNDWNILCNGETDYSSLADCPAGDGKQGLEFSGFVPYRRDPKNGNTVSDTVSYDYNYGQVNAWDSPFDFEYKLQIQRKSLATHFTGACREFFPEYENTVDYFKDGRTMSAMADVRKQLFTPGIFPLNDSENITGNSEYNFRLSRWNSTSSPNFKWKFHWKSSEDSGGFIPYVPGEGCFLYFRNELNHMVDSYTGEEKNLLDEMKIGTVAGAGTDCIGFAQRAFKYRGNRYKWTSSSSMPYDRAEGNPDPDSISRTEHQLAYPCFEKDNINCLEVVGWQDVCDKKVRSVSYYENLPTDQDDFEKPGSANFEEMRKKFLSIVPGDVITYGSDLPGDRENVLRSRAHIGVINYVDYAAMRNAMCYYDFFKAMEVIESGYAGFIFNVAKRKACDGNSESHMKYAGDGKCSNWYQKEDGGYLRIRAWSIQRLEVE